MSATDPPSPAAQPLRPRPRRGWSLRRQLLVGILLPVAGLVALNAALLYRQALAAADTAYDRTLLASAKAIGELLTVARDGQGPRLQATMPYSALEAFEADNRSRLYYKVTGFDGEMVSGFGDLPPWRGEMPTNGPYAALVAFYDDRFREEPVRVAVLLQPVAGLAGQGMATIQVAETLELRRTLASQILIDTLWRQLLLVAVIAGVVVWVVQRVTQPVRQLSEGLRARSLDDLMPIETADAPRELEPLVGATNHLIERLRHLLDDQKRFVRDTSHQLRTPLAVLRVQVQSARRGDVDPQTALAEIDHTVDRATELANQMLALAKVEQLRDAAALAARGHPGTLDPLTDWAEITRQVALDLAPLIADRSLEFDIDTETAWLHSHVWPLRELTRNLLHNAIRHSPPGARLRVSLQVDRGGTAVAARERHPERDGAPAVDWRGRQLPVDRLRARLAVDDEGPGVPPGLRPRLFQPFSPGDASGGSGLGLAICLAIVESLQGRIALVDRADDRILGAGLRAVVELPVPDPPSISSPSPGPPSHGF